MLKVLTVNTLLPFFTGVMCSFSAYSIDYTGDGKTEIRRGNLTDFTMSDSYRIIANGQKINISQGTINDNASIYLTGGLATSLPGSQVSISNVTINNNAIVSYSDNVMMRDLIFTGNSELKAMSKEPGVAVGNWIDVDGISAFDNAKLTFTFDYIQNVSGGLATIKNIHLYDSSVLSIDGSVRELYSHEVLEVSNLIANNNSEILLENNLIASAITMNDSATLNVNSQSQVSSVSINHNAIMALSDGARSSDTVVNNKGSVIINGNDALASNTQLNSGSIHVVNGMVNDTTVESAGILTLEQQGNLQGNTTLNGGRLVINGSDMMIGTQSDTINANDNALVQVNGDNNTLSNLNLSGGYVALTDPFASAKTEQHKTLNIDNLTGNGTFLMAVDLATPQGDFIQIQNASGDHGVLVKSSGYNPLSANALDIIAAKEGDATFQLNNKGQVVDLGTYQYQLTNSDTSGQNVWSLTPVSGDNGGGSISPSTDAILSMVSATQFIADGEMQSLRFRHGDLRNNAGDNAGIWGRFLLNDTRIYAAEGAAYKLKQNGMELGADNMIALVSGKLVLGGLAVFSDNTLEHSRGGQSSIDSYGIGGYATYFNYSGYYIDAVIKYNHFSDNLNVVMTDGELTKGSYSQNALTTSVETGFNYKLNEIVWVEPYIRGTYFVTDNQNFTLDNGMRAHTGVTRSARVELGSTLGIDYMLSNGKTVRPYLRAALENEFINSNNVVVNDSDEFNNDFSGLTGKYGIGVSAALSGKASMYAEANYRKGHNVESPVIANVGFRINF
ncbi:autotransporter outer membrane beta-barrel domain-containing protein [Yersinia ruckeri]|uniref:autotransporter outer membrane beta-barrel domain-containing protein n=1 Tax=Yersinia ruckeri TaxID=29486 RepID=UPI002237CDF0|nr:autotransporter outer membrane beta-barrel domain-containing protein [Yersinia ruckeri]MCW6625728.1 autotransporter outer membrane beta-barrel domain-containing protein [Yersinia ruckeri]